MKRPKKKRQFVNNGSPEQRRAGVRQEGGDQGDRQERKPNPGKAVFIHGPVKVDPEVVATFASLTRYAPKRDAAVRYAIANVVYTIAESRDWPKDKLWDALGRWNSALRGIKSLDEITNRHHGWQAVQRIRVALARAKNDPMHTSRIRHPMHQFIAEALQALDKGLERHLQAHPDLLMSGEELVGMAPLLPSEHFKHPLFKKPPSISPVPQPASSGKKTQHDEEGPTADLSHGVAAGANESTATEQPPSLAAVVARKLRAIAGI